MGAGGPDGLPALDVCARAGAVGGLTRRLLDIVPGIIKACYGHGPPEEAYVQFADGAMVEAPARW